MRRFGIVDAGLIVVAGLACQGARGLDNAMKNGCDGGVMIVETTVGTVGPYLVGVGNIREREGSPGVMEATVSVRREDAPSDSAPLLRKVVAAGETIAVEGRSFRVTRIVREPPRSPEPGGARSFVCLVEE